MGKQYQHLLSQRIFQIFFFPNGFLCSFEIFSECEMWVFVIFSCSDFYLHSPYEPPKKAVHHYTTAL